MERYFVGNNTAYGFKGFYEETLKSVDPVILLKGGPGTGKSSMLKRLAQDAKKRGYDCELWYCSGDPQSLDGVYIKDINAAVVDATAPHATGADLPAIKDFIFDLASSLSHEKLAPHRGEIEALFKCKKRRFERAYQHLRLARCHLDNKFELEREGVKEENVRAYAATLAAGLRETCPSVRAAKGNRRLFTHAISPSGENVYYDHLRGKRIYRVSGGDYASALFMEELAGLIKGGLQILNPLEPAIVDGIVVDDVAITRDAGHLATEAFENINLSVYENHDVPDSIEEENSAILIETAFAVEQLEKAREMHLAAETYFVGAMDFDNNMKIYVDISKRLFD